MIRNAYSYIRFSSAKQRKGDSQRRQVARAERWCQENKAVLDDTLALQDLGKSAFRGANAKTGALAGFLRAVETGKVKPGSALLVENLDRITRNDITEAAALFLQIVNAGITIVALEPREEVLSKAAINATPFLIYTVINQLILANEESKKKSFRSKANWDRRRKEISQKPMTRKLPGWLVGECEVVDDKPKIKKIKIDKEKAAIVKRIFNLAIDGKGDHGISRELNQTKTPTLGYGKVWQSSYVRLILNNRATIGEFQPHTSHEDKRQPLGKPIKGYYPAVIPEETFYRAQAVKETRKRVSGRKGTVSNIFRQLLKDARDGQTMMLRRAGRKPNGKRQVSLVSVGAIRGLPGSVWITIPYQWIEDAFLHFCNEIKPKDFLTAKAFDESESLAAKVETLESKMDEIKKKILTNADSESLLDVLLHVESEYKTAKASLEQVKGQNASGTVDAIQDTQSMLKYFQDAKDKDELRERLIPKIRQFVKEMWLCPFMQDGKKCVELQIFLKNGYHRRIMFVGENATFGAKDAVPSICPHLDLRNYRNEEFGGWYDKAPYEPISGAKQIRLTQAQKKEIKSLAIEGMRTGLIAARFRITTETVRRIKRA